MARCAGNPLNGEALSDILDILWRHFFIRTTRLSYIPERARVRLHVLIADRDGRLDADGICRHVPDWQAAGLWFCGPAGFGQALRRAFSAKGFAEERFHQELFEMR